MDIRLRLMRLPRWNEFTSVERLSQEKMAHIKTIHDSTKARVRRFRGLRNQVFSLAAAYNGLGVRQGSLYPPTHTHVHLMKRLQERWERDQKGLKEAETWMKEIELKF